MTYSIRTETSGIGITPDQVITRQQIAGFVDFALIDRATGVQILEGTESAFTSYGTTGTTASTAFAEEAAYDRLMIILADRIARRLAVSPTVGQ